MFWCRKKNFVSNKIFACKPDYISCSKKNNINRTISAIGLLLWILTLHNNSCSNTPSHNISNTLIYNSIKQFSKMRQSVSDYHKARPFRLLMSTIIQLTTLIKEEQSVHKSYSIPTQTNQPKAITTCITTTSHVPFLRSMVITRRRRFRVTVLWVFNPRRPPGGPLVAQVLSQLWSRTLWRSSLRAAGLMPGSESPRWLHSRWWTTAVVTSLRWTTWISRRRRSR